MRKPRTSLHLTNNNLNLNEDPSVDMNLRNLRREQALERSDIEALRKLERVPENTFTFSINGITTKPGTQNKIRAIDFFDYVHFLQYYNVPLLSSPKSFLKILYKGTSLEESYFCYVNYSTVFSPEQREFRSNVNPDVKGFWNVYFLSAKYFFKNKDDYELPLEPTRYFTNRFDTLVYLLEIPYLREKVQEELISLRLPTQFTQRYQREAVVPIVTQFSRRTGREVPEDVENVIRSFI